MTILEEKENLMRRISDFFSVDLFLELFKLYRRDPEPELKQFLDSILNTEEDNDQIRALRIVLNASDPFCRNARYEIETILWNSEIPIEIPENYVNNILYNIYEENSNIYERLLKSGNLKYFEYLYSKIENQDDLNLFYQMASFKSYRSITLDSYLNSSPNLEGLSLDLSPETSLKIVNRTHELHNEVLSSLSKKKLSSLTLVNARNSFWGLSGLTCDKVILQDCHIKEKSEEFSSFKTNIFIMERDSWISGRGADFISSIEGLVYLDISNCHRKNFDFVLKCKTLKVVKIDLKDPFPFPGMAIY